MSTDSSLQDNVSSPGPEEGDIPAGQVILEMRDITKEFPGVKALSDVSLTVRAARSTRSAARTAPASPR